MLKFRIYCFYFLKYTGLGWFLVLGIAAFMVYGFFLSINTPPTPLTLKEMALGTILAILFILGLEAIVD